MTGTLKRTRQCTSCNAKEGPIYSVTSLLYVPGNKVKATVRVAICADCFAKAMIEPASQVTGMNVWEAIRGRLKGLYNSMTADSGSNSQCK
jgi:hypothetical protein